jgi:hypothetical protein
VNAHEEAQASFGQAEEQMKIAMEKINLLAHELRGQGGVFGYPLITEFGKSFHNCTGASTRVTEKTTRIRQSRYRWHHRRDQG